jgi:anti-sigma regulatory factor (Ser/Thr protein kinase)
MPRGRTSEIRQAILAEVFFHGGSPVARVARQFGLTKQAIHLHLRSLLDDGYLEGEGEGRTRRYHLRTTYHQQRRYAVDGTFSEDVAWRDFVRPALAELHERDEAFCHYGLTEMVNNVCDHSGASTALVSVTVTHASVELRVTDNGVGLFQKIAAALGLADPRLSLIEVSKGKFTTDPQRHTGEGLFFTSRAFDKFSIRSANLLFHHSSRTDDWLVDVRDTTFKGTRITMGLLIPAAQQLQDVFSRFSSGPDDYRFSRTHVPLELATFGDESLVSRSSAKRVVSRIEKFDEVLLDFAGIRTVGQAFTDEIFRVFANEHPQVAIIAINANEQVTGMIRRAEAARRAGFAGGETPIA